MRHSTRAHCTRFLPIHRLSNTRRVRWPTAQHACAKLQSLPAIETYTKNVHKSRRVSLGNYTADLPCQPRARPDTAISRATPNCTPLSFVISVTMTLMVYYCPHLGRFPSARKERSAKSYRLMALSLRSKLRRWLCVGKCIIAPLAAYPPGIAPRADLLASSLSVVAYPTFPPHTLLPVPFKNRQNGYTHDHARQF